MSAPYGPLEGEGWGGREVDTEEVVNKEEEEDEEDEGLGIGPDIVICVRMGIRELRNVVDALIGKVLGVPVHV